MKDDGDDDEWYTVGDLLLIGVQVIAMGLAFLVVMQMIENSHTLPPQLCVERLDNTSLDGQE